jgi:nicotinamidase-related amidase
MDYQLGILGRVEQGDVLLNSAGEALAMARSAGMAVGYVRVAFTEADYAAIPASNISFTRAIATQNMDADAPHTQIHEAVAPKPGDVVVRKTRVGAFSTTDLEAQLAERGIDTLLLAGISTSGVVLSTVRWAADRDYRLYVLEDACADADAEVHRVLMGKVFPRQAFVIGVADLPELLAVE